MLEHRLEQTQKNPFENFLNFIPGNSLESIHDKEILEENGFQKQLLKSFRLRESEYFEKLHDLKESIEDFDELTHTREELRICNEMIFEAKEVKYFYTWYNEINKYKAFLETKFKLLIEPDFGVLHRYEKFNSQEVVFLFLWKWNAGLLEFKNQSALSSYLESHCASSTGKLKSTNSIITEIKNNGNDMPNMVNYVQNIDLTLKYIKF
tara:strand:- start:664 stop:1287 length:624 start_codon:yes stop_codon:yes gene_type:complete